MPELPIALEITPPARPKPHVLLRRAHALADRPARINVISRPDRWSSLDASIALRECGIEPVWHVANRGRSVVSIDAQIARARRAGLSHVLCVRGEYKAEDGPDTPKIREVVRMLVRGLPRARVGVTLNQHGRRDRVLANLWPKLEAGACSIQTQVAFELDSLEPLAAEIGRERPDVSITPMLLPVLSEAAALRVAHRLSIPFPAARLRALRERGAEAGWVHFAELVEQLRESPLYTGVAIMTPIDVDARFAARLRAALD